MLIYQYLEENARKYPDDASLVELNYAAFVPDLLDWEQDKKDDQETAPFRRELSWEVFNERANRIANFLLKMGIHKGDRVAIILKNCLEWLPCYFGILKTGAVAVMLNYRFDTVQIEHLLDNIGARCLIFGPESVDRITQGIEKIGHHRLMLFAGINCPIYRNVPCPSYAYNLSLESSNFPGKNPEISISEEDDAAIYFSSGTTGDPKGILLSHGSLSFTANVERKHHFTTKDDAFLCMPPFYHEGATCHWFGSLVSGSRAVILKGIKPWMILDAINREKITIVWLLVPWAQDILDALDRGDLKLSDYQNIRQWRLMHIGAQPVPISLIKHWREYFPDQQYETSYGLSESGGPGVLHTGIGNACKPSLIGIPGDGWECRIVDDKHQELPDGVIGELCCRGKGVMKCYYGNPKATAETIDADGWLYTSDMCYRKDGEYFIVDRRKDIIISGGENIYPVQIEEYLRTNEAIDDAAVLGFPDKRLGEAPGAIIQLKPGYHLNETDIHIFCQKLPRYERPAKIIFDEVLRNGTGKIDKKAMRKKYGTDNLILRTEES